MKKLLIAALMLLLVMPSCKSDEIILPWDPVTPTNPQDKPDDPQDPGDDPSGGDDPAELFKGKPRYVWIDASANFQYFANDKERIARDLQKVKDTGFTDVIVDVRPTEGTVLFRSSIAPAAKRLAAWVGGNYKFVNRTETFDYLQEFINAGHKVGLRVNAAINTFVGGYGGYYGLESEGPLFSGDMPAEWASSIGNDGAVVSSFSKDAEGTIFLNPANDEVQTYMLNLIAELAAYDLDGIILDRCRYDDTGLGSDYSDISKAKFTEYLGSEPTKWPVFNSGSKLPSRLSDEQKNWLAFRVKVIHDFVEKAASTVHSTNSKLRFGVYVGAWYSEYYSSGVNWASPKYLTHKHYPSWANEDYHNYGYADHCDFMMLGCYAAASSIYGAGEWKMQGFCKNAQTLLAGDTEFAGGPDVGNPTGWEKGEQDAKIPDTIDACINAADGYFVFDLCHIRMYDYWAAFKKGFDNYLNTL